MSLEIKTPGVFSQKASRNKISSFFGVRNEFVIKTNGYISA